MKYPLIISSVLILSTISPANADENGWYVRPFVGFSQMSDQTAESTNLGNINGNSEIELDSGFNAGLGVGYRFNKKLGIELDWEYRSNESTTTLADGTNFPEGNYASNMFSLNGLYYPQVKSKRWSPYVGAGLTIMQEVDIDLEDNGAETSLSGSGDLGYQLFAGIDYKINQKLSIGTELRYGSTSGIDLEGENNNSQYKNLDYSSTTLQVGLKYRF